MMSPASTSADRSPKKCAWLCFLLPLMFFCDPFLTVIASSSVLSVHHPPSYRATIASPELLKFSAPENCDSAMSVNCDVLDSFILFGPKQHPLTQPTQGSERLVADRFEAGNSWFRPPPVV
jgi:hypothetical protein